MLYKYDTTIKDWSSTPQKSKNQDLHDLFLETHFWINLYLVKVTSHLWQLIIVVLHFKHLHSKEKHKLLLVLLFIFHYFNFVS